MDDISEDIPFGDLFVGHPFSVLLFSAEKESLLPLFRAHRELEASVAKRHENQKTGLYSRPQSSGHCVDPDWSRLSHAVLSGNYY